MSDFEGEDDLSDEELLALLEKELAWFSRMNDKYCLNAPSHEEREAIRREITRPRTDKELSAMSEDALLKIQFNFQNASMGLKSNEECDRWQRDWDSSPLNKYLNKLGRERTVNCWKFFACLPDMDFKPKGKRPLLFNLCRALYVEFEFMCADAGLCFLSEDHPKYDSELDARLDPDYDPFDQGADISELVDLFYANDWLDKYYYVESLDGSGMLKPNSELSEEELLKFLIPQAAVIARKLLNARDIPIGLPDPEYLARMIFEAP